MRKFELSEKEIKQFHRDGYIGPFTLYKPEEMQQHYKKIKPQLISDKKAVYKSKPGLSGSTTLSSYDRHFDVPFLAEHIMQEKIVDRLSSILGEDILCWRTEFFPKYPGDEGTDWHQANTFAGIAGDKKPQIEWPDRSGFGGTITVWTAFTESNIDNGCMQIIPGTHTTMFYDETKNMSYESDKINSILKESSKRGFFGYDYRQLQVNPEWSPDESKAVSLEMKPGQFFIFWSTLLHGSHPHSGKNKNMRLGFSGRYVPTSVKVYPYSNSLDEFGGKASLNEHKCILVSGVDNYGHNKIVKAKD